MPNTEPVGFYFALPRLFSGTPARSEKNWIEANAVGTLIHLIAYLFAHQLVLGDSSITLQLLLALPLAFLVWVFWLLALYFNSFMIKLLRAVGLIRTMPDRHAQSLLIGIMTTFFAWQLIAAGSWSQWFGIFWIIAVALNLLAALVLSLRDAAPTTTD